MKTKRILSVVLTFVMAFSLLPNFALTISAATTILFCPSNTWENEGGRYAVRYESDAGGGWAAVNTTSEAGYYSVSIPECWSFMFCLMDPGTEENNDYHVLCYSSVFILPETGENCLRLGEGMLSDCPGTWTTEYISTNFTDILYLKPNEEWINSGFRMVACFFTEESAAEEWVDVTATEFEGIYAAEVPGNFDYITFYLMYGPNNTFEEAHYRTYTYSYEAIAGYNCLVLAANDGSNMTPGDWRLDEELAADPGSGGTAEGGTGGEEIIQNCNVVYGSSADNMSNEGNLRGVISSPGETVYIRLTKNVMLEEQIVVDGKKIYLDLANYTIDVVEYGFVIKNGGSLTLSASTETTSTETETVEEESTEEEEIKEDLFVNGELQGAVYSTHASKNGVGIFDVKRESYITFESGIYAAQHGVIVTSELSTITVNGGEYKTSLSLPIFRLNNYTELKINGGCFLGAETIIEINANTRPHIHITDFDKECEHISIALTSDEIQDTSTSFVLIQNNDLMIYMIHDGEKTVTDHAPLGEPFYVGWCHKVTYDVNGGTHIALNEYRFPIPGYIEFPAWNTMNEPYMMEFSHWECNGQNYQTGDTLYVEETGTSTLKAIWKEQVQYNVTLHSNLDPEQTQTTEEYSMYLPLSDVPSDWTVPEALTLLGWALAPDGAASWSKLKLTGDTHLYAIYTTKKYDINFSSNGGSGIIHPISKTHNVDCYLPMEYPVREGYKFCGWSKTRDGEAMYQPGEIYAENERGWLYAVWKIVEFNIVRYDTETKTATIGIPEAGTYTVAFADYEGGRLSDIEFVPVTVSDAEVITATITKSFTLGTDDKIMLLQNMTKPLCKAYIVK